MRISKPSNDSRADATDKQHRAGDGTVSLVFWNYSSLPPMGMVSSTKSLKAVCSGERYFFL